MPAVGNRKTTMRDFSHDPMYEYAKSFADVTADILSESQVDYASEPVKATMMQPSIDAIKEFFTKDCVIDKAHLSASEIQDQIDMMNEVCINDIQALRESGPVGMSQYNPMVGLALPMHKYLMLNCVFAQALPRFVAKAPFWTETMETRYLITPEGKRIDIANEQNQIFSAWKSTNAPKEVAIALPEKAQVDILNEYFHVPRTSHNLSVATHISAVAVEEYVEVGTPIVTIGEPDDNGVCKVTEGTKDSAAGKALVWKPWHAEFTPGYGEYNRIITQPVDIEVAKDGSSTEHFHDVLFASEKDNMFEIQSSGGIKAVKLSARYDASSRMLKTCKVDWRERTTFVQIPEADGITVPITPEEVKDVSALYGINQVTKYMSIIKDVLENVKDDDLKENLDQSFLRLDDDHRLAKTIDFAPREGYYSDHLEWLQKTFMNTLDQFITGLLTVLRDPNMEICIIGRPGLIRQITPQEYTYRSEGSVGPIELNFSKTVVTSDKRVYKFISSDKLFGNDNLIVLLRPKNSNRIVYRLYDYQMYISNEIRDNENPALPAMSAFQRYKFFEFQPVQGRLFVANPSGLREHLPNVDPIGQMYTNNDLGRVYTHYDAETGKNVATENVLP